jgi:peptide deformylase
MNLVYNPHPALYKVADVWDFENPLMDANELVTQMQEIRRTNRGIGLAAPQVDLNTRVIVVGMGEDIEHAFINPSYEIVEEDGTEYMIEGCLSFPSYYINIKRPKTIKLTYYEEDGTKVENQPSGITARIIQHETDHLDGLVFTRRASMYHLNKAKKEAKRLERMKKRETN